MTTSAKLIFDVIGPPTLARFDARCQHPMAQQQKLLLALLRENADTEFGRRHDFASIETFSRFQKQVPITEYDDIAPYIEASRHGEPAQLTRARPVFYGMTSGTTGPAKYIPVTEASRHAKSRLMRLWLSGLLRDHPSIVDGVILQPASPEVEEYAPDGTPCEDDCGAATCTMGVCGCGAADAGVMAPTDLSSAPSPGKQPTHGCSFATSAPTSTATVLLLAIVAVFIRRRIVEACGRSSSPSRCSR